MNKFYNNIECEVIAELPNGEVAITFITGYYNEHDSEYGSYSEPIETTLVVQKKQLTDKPITRDQIVLEREQMLNEIERIKYDRIQEANIQIRNERTEIEKELKVLREERSQIMKGSEIFETIRKYRAGEFHYAVSIGTFTVKNIEEFAEMLKKNYEIDNETNDYSGLSIRILDGNVVKNGSWSTYKLFETTDEVKQYIADIAKERIKNSRHFSVQDIKILDSFGVNFEGYYEKRKEIIENIILRFKRELIRRKLR